VLHAVNGAGDDWKETLPARQTAARGGLSSGCVMRPDGISSNDHAIFDAALGGCGAPISAATNADTQQDA
jgi:hypothetical protein